MIKLRDLITEGGDGILEPIQKAKSQRDAINYVKKFLKDEKSYGGDFGDIKNIKFVGNVSSEEKLDKIPNEMQEFITLSVFDREKFERVDTLTYEVTCVGDVNLTDEEKSQIDDIPLRIRKQIPPVKLTHGEWVGQKWGWIYFNQEIDSLNVDNIIKCI